MKNVYSLLTLISATALVAAAPAPFVKPGPVVTDATQGVAIPNTNFGRREEAFVEDFSKKAVEIRNAVLATRQGNEKESLTPTDKVRRVAKKGKGKGKKAKAAAAAAAAEQAAAQQAAGNATAIDAAAGNATAEAANQTADASANAGGDNSGNGQDAAQNDGQNGGGQNALTSILDNLGINLADLGLKKKRSRAVRRAINVWEAEAMEQAAAA